MLIRIKANENRQSWRVWLVDAAGHLIDTTTIARSQMTTIKGVVRRARKWANRAGHVPAGVCVPYEVEK